MKRIFVLLIFSFSFPLYAACLDNVVLVHGNAGSPADWNNTYNSLRNTGYASQQIFRPSWGNPNCPACNNHSGWEELPVIDALADALEASCTGQIDVIGHSMGVTLAAKEIRALGISSDVDAFVGIAGAVRGLWSCGTYPFNVPTSTCGSQGLSVNSPVLQSLAGQSFGQRMYSIKSYYDQVVCYPYGCLVGGVHSSRIAGEQATYTFNNLGHFGLQNNTTGLQLNLLD